LPAPERTLIIDGTFATPVNQRPLAHGVDLVIHSCTKYLGGHNDLLAGAVCGRAGLVQAIKDLRGVLGGVLDPQSAFLLIRGLKTLPCACSARTNRACRGALARAAPASAPRVLPGAAEPSRSRDRAQADAGVRRRGELPCPRRRARDLAGDRRVQARHHRAVAGSD